MKRRKGLAVTLAAAMVCSMLFMGCSSGGGQEKAGENAAKTEDTKEDTVKADDASKDGAQGDQTYKIGMSIDTTSQAWRAGLVEDVSKEAAKHPQVELTITDASGNTEKQISDVEDLITKGVQAILISPIESKPLANVCKKAYDQGIHVIVLDRELEGEDWTCFIGANNRDIGAAAGDFLVKYMDENHYTKLVEIQGTPGSSPCRDRSEPMMEKIQGTDIELVAQQTANWTENEAVEVTENLLQAYPKGEIEVIYAQCDVMALGALKAMKSAGREEIKIVSVDGQKEALEAIKDGSIVGTFTYPFPGAAGVQVAMKLIDGETVEKNIGMESVFIDSSNVDEYYNPDSAF
ncbi:MAG: substrate-binding domain-containing protein [Blautia sp.]|jgi:ribose transport system substrate-binding protein